MARSISETFSNRSTRSLEHRAFHAVVLKGEPIPLDVAAELMAEGFDIEAYEEGLERARQWRPDR